jgi:hypothetical protein
MGMTMQLSKAAHKVIALATAIREYWETELPKRHPDYPLVRAGEDSGPPPPQEKELKDFLAGLPGDQVYKLLLIMYLGRGDFGTEDLSGSYKYLKDTFGRPAWAISQMMEKAPLAEYVTDGLAVLQKTGLDPDNLALTSARSAAFNSKGSKPVRSASSAAHDRSVKEP